VEGKIQKRKSLSQLLLEEIIAKLKSQGYGEREIPSFLGVTPAQLKSLLEGEKISPELWRYLLELKEELFPKTNRE
jgi:hypothetical protein